MEQYLNSKFPCRSEVIRNICNLVGDPEEAYPPCIFIYGHSGTGKTAIIKEFIHQMNKKKFKGIFVDCVESYSTKVLVENILCALTKDQEIKCDTMKDFVEELQILCEPQKDSPQSYIFVLDNAERLRDMDGNVLPVLLRLQHFVGANICIVLLSQLPFEKFYSKTGLPDVIDIFFPQYTKSAVLKILSADFDNTKDLLKNWIISSSLFEANQENTFKTIDDLSIDFFNNYLNLFLTVFFKACCDVPELKITARKCFIPYILPILEGTIQANDVSRLWRNISAPLKVALAQVYMRLDLASEKDATNQTENALMDQSVRQMALSLELPYYGKYLLIAAFLASYNSAKHDKRLFVKHHGKQKKRVQTINNNAKNQDKMATSLGPKSFSIDRLLAIFYAILDEKVGLTCNLLSQISTLVHLKVLSFVSGESNVMDGSARLQCTVSLDFVYEIGKVVGFNVRQYLSDFM